LYGTAQLHKPALYLQEGSPMPDPITLPPFPAPLRWELPPAAWGLDAGTLSATAGPRTDLFVSPQGDAPVLNAHRLLGPVGGDFQLSARVTVGFAGAFDAGALLVWRDERSWAKLCFEFSPQRRPMVVSVVTRGLSDDANGFTVDGDSVWLRVSRMGGALAFHASTDGRWWDLIRHFALDAGEAPLVGFVAQAPVGEGCAVRFDDIRFAPARLVELRNGE
jgi:regulation of enolase protein 1 (concanavalin A-like superfamily)